MLRERECVNCGEKFSYEIGKGNDRIHCSSKCRRQHQLNLRKQRFESLPLCKEEGCNNKATRKSYGLCENCYCRFRRNGTTEKREIKYRWERNDGYIVLTKKGHPIAQKYGRIHEHRFVAYEKYGEGPHKCFWCKKELEWENIVIDHLNENRQDNRIENLVISCNGCNRARGAAKPFIKNLKEDSIALFIETTKEYWNKENALQTSSR